MKRIEKIASMITDAYINEYPDGVTFSPVQGWPNKVCGFFRAPGGLRKRSITVPAKRKGQDYKPRMGTLRALLYKEILADIKSGLGYRVGINHYTNRFQVFSKRDTNIFYSRHDWREFLKKGGL